MVSSTDSLGGQKSQPGWQSGTTPCSNHSALPCSIASPNGSRHNRMTPTCKKQLCNFIVLHIYSHNVNGLKSTQDDKLENLANALAAEDITFCCLQETWLGGDTLNQIKASKDSKPAMCIFFHHGQPHQKGRGSGGVGILLGPKGKSAWQLA
eukprot:8924020-Ditylum_brightwellii.AAC.1